MSTKLARVSAWLSAAALLVGVIADLVSGPWQGCSELATTAGEKVALIGGFGDAAALLLAAWSIAWTRDWRAARSRMALTIVVATSLVAMIVLLHHHPYGPGCG